MYDTNDLLKVIKQASIEAVEATKPVNVVFGVVQNASPLKIQVEQKLILDKDQLIVAKHLTNYSTVMYVNMDTDYISVSFNFSHSHNTNLDTCSVEQAQLEDSKSHKHNITGNFNVIVKNGLKVGEKVILIRMQKGQKYIVLDRIGE